MSATTRIRRPTYSTPRRDPRPLRYLHVSTAYAWAPVNPFFPSGPTHFAKFGKGVTYRRPRRAA